MNHGRTDKYFWEMETVEKQQWEFRNYIKFWMEKKWHDVIHLLFLTFLWQFFYLPMFLSPLPPFFNYSIFILNTFSFVTIPFPFPVSFPPSHIFFFFFYVLQLHFQCFPSLMYFSHVYFSFEMLHCLFYSSALSCSCLQCPFYLSLQWEKNYIKTNADHINICLTGFELWPSFLFSLVK